MYIYTKRKKFNNQKHRDRSSKRKLIHMKLSIVVIGILKILKGMKNDQFLPI